MIVNVFNSRVSQEEGGPSIDSEGNIAFHQAIIKASDNIFISQFGEIVRAALHHTIYMSVLAAVDHVESIDSHRKLLEVIERHNPEQAYVAMSRVLSRTMLDLELRRPA